MAFGAWQTVGYTTFKSQNGNVNFCLVTQACTEVSGTNYNVKARSLMLTTQTSASYYNCKANVTLVGNGTTLYSGTTNAPKTSSAWDTGLAMSVGGTSYKKGFIAVAEKSFTVSGLGSNISIPIKSTYQMTWTEDWAPVKTTQTASGNLSLATLVSPTTPSISPGSVTLGSKATITMNNAVSSAKHNLEVNINGNKVSLGTGLGNSFTWTTSTDYAKYIPNNSEINCTITCTTYSGSTAVGSKTCTVKLVVPTSLGPTINSGPTLTEASPKLTGKNIGAFVQNVSQIAFNVSASGQKNATIKSYSTKLAGVTYNGSSFTSNVITATNKDGNLLTVIDSRGIQTTKTFDYTILPYSIPTIEGTVQRCDTSGKPSAGGTRLLYSAKGSITSLDGKNTIHTFKLGYKLSTASSYTYVTLGTGLTLSVNNVMLQNVTFETSKKYDIIFVAEDLFNTTNYATELSVKKVLINVKDDNIAFGKLSEGNSGDNKMEIAKNVEITGTAKLNGKEILGWEVVDTW